jgi:hypothetical protein
MKILVCGTSTAMGNTTRIKSWVYYLQQKLDCEVVNLSRVGCGNTYIHDSILAEITERPYDLVLVSWTAAKRMDFRTFKEHNPIDWSNLGGNPHLHLLQKDWLFPHTVFADEKINQLRQNVYDNYFPIIPRPDELHQMTLLKILSMQSVLKSYGVPYVFIFYRKLIQLKKFNNYYKKIDWNNVHDKNLFLLAKHNNLWDNKSYHPTNEAHKIYADLMYDFLSTKNLIKP